ncbi:hypothetical protein DAEQUDRAFT_143122 [Daedalea quercina L-15889]|uniref:Uncharacterized protein n=1 Tax=Daedalea quercina L-15889 TaxID=1314783 RepID=A0A165RVY7_9APHY|nr:hypothetical protein DAEQUDRAFT_143122 [Daedalea quercina L-15889]
MKGKSRHLHFGTAPISCVQFIRSWRRYASRYLTTLYYIMRGMMPYLGLVQRRVVMPYLLRAFVQCIRTVTSLPRLFPELALPQVLGHTRSKRGDDAAASNSKPPHSKIYTLTLVAHHHPQGIPSFTQRYHGLIYHRALSFSETSGGRLWSAKRVLGESPRCR